MNAPIKSMNPSNGEELYNNFLQMSLGKLKDYFECKRSECVRKEERVSSKGIFSMRAESANCHHRPGIEGSSTNGIPETSEFD